MLKRLLGLCAVAAVMLSCGSAKNIAYLQDAAAGEMEELNPYTNIIKPGDLLSIIVSSSKPELAVPFNLYSVKAQMSAVTPQAQSRQELEGYTVNPEGNIDFPTLGTLHIAGMTRNEVADMIKGMLTQYMPDPIVTINFLNFNITVIGEVEKPGNFRITGDRVSILEALGMAGDMTEFGDREKRRGDKGNGRRTRNRPSQHQIEKDIRIALLLSAAERCGLRGPHQRQGPRNIGFPDELPDHRIARFPRKLHRDAHLLHNQRKRQITDPQS